MAQDLYDVLGVSRTAPIEEIKKAFRALAMQHHPDRNPGDAEAARRYAEINAAKEVLLDQEKRAMHDNHSRGISGLAALLARPLGAAAVVRSIPSAPKARRNGSDRLIVLPMPVEGQRTVQIRGEVLPEPLALPEQVRSHSCGIVQNKGAAGENGGDAGTLFVLFLEDI